MKSGILADNEGYDILINAEVRTFRDVWEYAYDAARNSRASSGTGTTLLKSSIGPTDRSKSCSRF